MHSLSMAMRSINFADAKSLSAWLESVEAGERRAEIGAWRDSHHALIAKIRERREELSRAPRTAHSTAEKTPVDAQWVERVFRITEEKQLHMADAVIRPLHFNVVLSEFRNNVDALAVGNTSVALSTLLEKLCKSEAEELEAQREDSFTFLHHYLGKHPPLSPASRVMWMETFTLDSLNRSKTAVLPDSVVAAFQSLVKNVFALDVWSHEFRQLLLAVLEHDYAAVLERCGRDSSPTPAATKRAKAGASSSDVDKKEMFFVHDMDNVPLAYLPLAKVEGRTVTTSYNANKVVDDAMRKFHNAEDDPASRLLYSRLVGLYLDSYLHYHCGADTFQLVLRLAKAKQNQLGSVIGLDTAHGEGRTKSAAAIERVVPREDSFGALPSEFKKLVLAIGGWLAIMTEADVAEFYEGTGVEWLKYVP